MSSLRIIFTGLCAGGPPGPLPGNPAEPVDGPYQVVMPASLPRRAKRSPHLTIPVHLPFIAVRTNDLVNPRDPARRLESCREKNGRGEEFFVWILARERVTFETGDEPWKPGKIHYTQTNPNPGKVPLGRRGDLTDERDVNWLPDMRLIFPGAATLRPECLPPGADRHVAVQMTINSGTLSSFFPENFAKSERPTRFLPAQSDPPLEHVVARQSMFVSELPRKARTLRISFSAMDPGRELESENGLGSLELELTPAGVTIFAGNTDMDDLLKTIRGEVTESRYDLDSDFELYYDLLQLPQAAQPVNPRRDDQPEGGGPSGGGGEPGGGEPGGGQPGGGPPEGPDLPIPIPDPRHGGHGECPGLRVTIPGGTS